MLMVTMMVIIPSVVTPALVSTLLVLVTRRVTHSHLTQSSRKCGIRGVKEIII